MSKGSNRRPAAVPSSVVDERWARTFGPGGVMSPEKFDLATQRIVLGSGGMDSTDIIHVFHRSIPVKGLRGVEGRAEDEMRRNGYIPVHSGLLTGITEA